MAMRPPPQTILVIGGGLGGLAFTQILRYSLVSDKYRVIIFERDATPTHRAQGYQIAINKSGLSHISSIPHIASVLESLHKDNAASIVDSELNLMLQQKHEPGSDGLAGLVNRWKLRNALAEGLHVEWGKKFVRYEESETCVVAHFEDGTQVSGDLLIGADGVKSRVRAQRCPALQLQQLPVLKTAGSLTLTPAIRARIPRVVQLAEESYLVLSLAAAGNSLLLMEYEPPDGGETSLAWAFSFLAPASAPDLPTDLLKVKQAIDGRAAVFGKELASMIHETKVEENLFAAPKHLTAIVPTKGNPLGKTSRVTLLGDAAHAMTTHRGLGANTAFADAFDLVRALTHEEDPWQAVAEYEQMMIKRGFEAIRMSLQSARMVHMAGLKSVLRNAVIRVVGWILWAKHRLLR